MATKPTENTAPIEEQFDDELLYATDTDGNRIPDDDIIAEAEHVVALTFKFRGRNHIVEVRALNVPARLTNRQSAITTGLAIEAGYKPGDKFESETETGQIDPRLQKLLDLTEFSTELKLVQAEIAIAATVKDGKGRLRTSVPQFREDLTAQNLLDYGGLGEAYITVIRDWLRPT